MMREIRTTEKPKCFACNAYGKVLHSKQKDKLFGAPGYWNIYKCSNNQCGLLWLNPMPTVEDIGEAYRNYYTHSLNIGESNSLPAKAKRYIKNCYLASRFGYTNTVNRFTFIQQVFGLIIYLFPARRADVDFSIMHIPFKKNGRLLEVGCGSGAMLGVMQDLGWHVEGVDVDSSGVKVARANGLEVHLGDVYSKHYADNSFDAITLSHVIEHVHDPIGLIRECARILKPGGKISIVTPNSASLGHSLYKSSWLHLDPPRHLHIFNSPVLVTLAINLGLKIETNETIIRDADTLFVASRSIRNTGAFAWGSDAGILSKIWAKILQLLEWFILKFSPFRGEEILLVVTKDTVSE
jgi:2-polyprenyl-3-methyl-5-hydroxy-6-metoxy-1,4-benzoquinol methylase